MKTNINKYGLRMKTWDLKHIAEYTTRRTNFPLKLYYSPIDGEVTVDFVGYGQHTHENKKGYIYIDDITKCKQVQELADMIANAVSIGA